VDGWATVTSENAVQVLLYCHHDDWDVKETYDIDLVFENLPFDCKVLVKHSRIDAEHSNAYAEWVRQGKPNYPNPGQYAAIKARDGIEFCEAPQTVLVHEGRLEKHFALPTHAISFLTIEKTERYE
jgi:xylan 1,4-beta-xylosidase